jgi:hypothetical protein
MDELMLVRGLRAERGVPADAQERVRERLLQIVDGEAAPDVRSARGLRIRPRWSLRMVAVTVVAGGIALGLLGALPESGPLSLLPGGGSSAVARAAAALTGPGGTIVHARASVTVTSVDGSAVTRPVEIWQQSSPPFDSREVVLRGGAFRPELATVDGSREFYDPRTNTIYTEPSRKPPGGAAGKPAESGGGSGLDPLAPDFSVERLRSLLTSGRAHEDGRVSVDGRAAIRIVSSAPEMTLIVDADTYKPLEWQVPAAGAAGHALTVRFETYEWLPATAASAALVSLSAQHPGATRRTAPPDGAGTDAATK